MTVKANIDLTAVTEARRRLEAAQAAYDHAHDHERALWQKAERTRRRAHKDDWRRASDRTLKAHDELLRAVQRYRRLVNRRAPR